MTDPTKVVLAPPPDRVPVKRALLSVYDKTGLVELAQGLHGLGIELWSSGGTAAANVEDHNRAQPCVWGRTQQSSPSGANTYRSAFCT